MKKIAYIILSVLITFVTLYIPDTGMITSVSAKISGDYSYDILSDNTAVITNYNGSDSEVKIPDTIDGKTVKKIGYGAFAEVKSITFVEIPETVTVIDSYAFSKCTQLQRIKLPDSIVTINQNAFAGCSSLQEFQIPRQMKSLSYGIFFGCKSLESITIPEGIEVIGGMAFSNCTSLKDVVLPASLNSLGNNAFNDCIAIESITLPEGLDSIGSAAFSGCLSLNDISIPETLTSIGLSAFQDCISLERIYLPESIEAIGYAAFSGCAKLKEINIPKQITELGNAMFSGCSSLESIEIPDGVETLGDNFFSGCVNLKDVIIPDSVIKIGTSAFSYCRNLRTVELPKNKEFNLIAVSLFRYCDNLDNIVLPSTIKTIDSTAFSDCLNLKSVIIPNTTITLGSRVFSNTPNVVVLVHEGSKAEEYAKNNTIAYKNINSYLNLDRKELTLKADALYRMNVIQSPYTLMDNTKLIWSSSDDSVASVNEDGVITALKAGTATITVQNANGQSDICEITVDGTVVPIESITLDANTLIIKKGTKTGIGANILPKNTTNDKGITWSSDNPEIATISSTGILFAKKPGTVTITGTASNGMSDQCVVTITSEISTVSMNVTAMNLEIGTSQSLRASIDPVDTTDDKTLTWKSSNEKVAAVDQNGKVDAIAKGTATITVRTMNGRTAECVVTVNAEFVEIPIESVTLNTGDVSLEEGSTKALSATVLPKNTTMDKTLTWSSDDESIASIDDKGKVIAHNEGMTTIRTTTVNGKEASCRIIVEKKSVTIESVTIQDEELSLRQEKTYTLNATVLPENTTMDKTIQWSSDDSSIVVIDENGVLQTVKAGVTYIRATTVNGLTSECKITVLAWDTSALEDVIEEARTYEEADYTVESYQKLLVAIQEATAIIEDETALQSDVEALLIKLNDAIDHLELRINIDTLKALLNELGALDGGNYTINSYTALQTVVQEANAAVEEGNLSNVQIKQYVENLYSLKDALISTIDLKASISAGLAIDESVFTKDSYAVLKAALEAAEKELVSGTNESIALAIENIRTSIANLVAVDESDDTEIYKDILKASIDKANTIKANGGLTNVHETIVKLFDQRLDEAVIVYTDKKATKQMLMGAWSNLAEAMHYLSFTANKTNLQSLMGDCAALDLNLYVNDENMVEFKSAMSEAQTVLDDSNALDERINKSFTRLSTAKDNLILKEDVVDVKLLTYMIEKSEDAMGRKEYYETMTENWKKFEKALTDAITARSNAESQASVNAAANALANAYTDIRLIANEDVLAELHAFVMQIDALDLTLYSDTNATYFMDVRSVLNTLIETESITANDYETAVHMMQEVTERMQDIVQPSGDQEPSTDDGNVKDDVAIDNNDEVEEQDDKNNESTKNSDKVDKNNVIKATGVKTGDTVRYGIIGLWFAGSGAVLAMSAKKKKEKKS